MKQARLLMDITIKELALRSGMTPESISNIERHKQIPSLKKLKILSEVLNMPIYYLGCYEALPENTLGQKIKKARFFNGLTAIELAEMFNVDVKTIFNWESDNAKPSERHINEVNKFITNINETST
ncbi:helix-turn-helix domain-containing protein [Paenibacillus sp. SN-8-1]|uniref:helix-turn-helix domain-containing protein n=1 Tax=Paenibacillus sp. SN-8-1 TaxID=3435409 RepID=UPI003D9A9EBF